MAHAARDEFVSEYSVPGIIRISQRFLSPHSYQTVCPNPPAPDDGFCLLSCHNSGSFPKGDGRECVLNRDNHKTASWVIDIEVIGLIQDKISFARPLQVRKVIFRNNYFMRYLGVPVHGDSSIPNFFTFYVLSMFICLLPYILKS